MKSKVSLRLMVICAMMVALAVVLNRFCSIHTAGWTIGFAFVPIAMTAILYGPLAGAVVGGLADLVGALLFPFGAYFPGFTATAALMGAVWGWFLHTGHGKGTFLRMLGASVVNNLVLGLCVNTLWVSILYGSKTYWGWFVYRLPQYAILIPVNLILLPVLLKLAEKLKKYQ